MKSLSFMVQKLWPRLKFICDRVTESQTGQKLDAPGFHSGRIKVERIERSFNYPRQLEVITFMLYMQIFKIKLGLTGKVVSPWWISRFPRRHAVSCGAEEPHHATAAANWDVHSICHWKYLWTCQLTGTILLIKMTFQFFITITFYKESENCMYM